MEDEILGYAEPEETKIPIKPEESFTDKALRIGQQHASKFMQGGLDFGNALQPMPGIKRANPFGEVDETQPKSAIEDMTQEIAYDVGSMGAMAMAGSLFGPMGAAAGAGVGLMKGLYSAGKLSSLANAAKHGLKYIGAPNWVQELAKLGTYTGTSLLKIPEKLEKIKPELYKEVEQVFDPVMVEADTLLTELSKKAAYAKRHPGPTSDFTLNNIGDITKLVVKGKDGKPMINLRDAWEQNKTLNDWHRSIKKGANEVQKGALRFKVVPGETKEVDHLNNIISSTVIEPYTSKNPLAGQPYYTAQGIHRAENAAIEAEQNLANNPLAKKYLSGATAGALLFGGAGYKLGGIPGAAIGGTLGAGVGAGASKIATRASKINAFIKNSPKARELYGRAFSAAVKNNTPEFLKLTKQLDREIDKHEDEGELLGFAD